MRVPPGEFNCLGKTGFVRSLQTVHRVERGPHHHAIEQTSRQWRGVGVTIHHRMLCIQQIGLRSRRRRRRRRVRRREPL